MVDMKSGMFTSISGEWETPIELYRQLDEEFHFILDPACTSENQKAPKRCNDGLKDAWHGSVFLNPPYGRIIGKWMEKCWHEHCFGVSPIVALIPSRTDTIWWHDYVMKASEIRFIKGRLKFSGYKNSAPFPSAVVIWK